jgi:thioesterase domain-containing protein
MNDFDIVRQALESAYSDAMELGGEPSAEYVSRATDALGRVEADALSGHLELSGAVSLLKDIKAENARLRESMKLIANGEYDLPDGSCQDIARAALEPMKATSQWISVKDRVPEKTEWCLVFADGAMNCMAWNSMDDEWQDWTLPKAPNITDTITHWMPLPKPPVARAALGKED